MGGPGSSRWPKPPDGGPEPTKDDLRNGWTRESLRAYLAERQQQQRQWNAEQQELRMKRRKARTENTVGFDPHNWGR